MGEKKQTKTRLYIETNMVTRGEVVGGGGLGERGEGDEDYTYHDGH